MKFKKYFIVFLSVIIIVVTSVVSVSAATTTSSAKTLTFEEVKTKFNIKYDETKYPYYYFAKETDNSRYIVFVSSSSNCWTVYKSLSLRYNSLNNNNNSGIYFLCYVSSGSQSSFVPSNGDIVLSFGDGGFSKFVMLSSNSDLLFDDGTVFFQRPTPLLDRLLSLVPGVGEKITGDLGILTTCGIGCLALLIGLSLLPKVLYKFL